LQALHLRRSFIAAVRGALVKNCFRLTSSQISGVRHFSSGYIFLRTFPLFTVMLNIDRRLHGCNGGIALTAHK